MQECEILSSRFWDCTFRHCSVVESSFRDCIFVNCHFLHCDLSLIRIEGSSFSGTKFEKSKAIGIDWTRGDWPKIQIRHPLVFQECVLSHSTFIGLDLEELVFTGCQATDVDFREANLTKADFSNTDLSNSLFLNTVLREADFQRAFNYEIDACQNEIEKAKFSLPEAMSLLYSLDIDLSEDNHAGISLE